MSLIPIIIKAGTVCGGEVVAKGDLVEATDQEARQLIGAGMATFADDIDQPLEPTGDTLHERIVNALFDFDENDSDLWTADELPKVDAIENVLGEELKAEDRDAAWLDFKAE